MFFCHSTSCSAYDVRTPWERGCNFCNLQCSLQIWISPYSYCSAARDFAVLSGYANFVPLFHVDSMDIFLIDSFL